MAASPDGRFVSSDTISINEWHHFAVSYVKSESKLYVYIDGALAGTASCGGSTTNGDDFCIGRARDLDRGNIGCRGYMAAVRVYNRALSASDVMTLSMEF